MQDATGTYLADMACELAELARRTGHDTAACLFRMAAVDLNFSTPLTASPESPEPAGTASLDAAKAEFAR